MGIKILIDKRNRKFQVEIYDMDDSNYFYTWSGENLLDSYNDIYSELLKLNKINDKITFLYKTDSSGFMRHQGDKKQKVGMYLNYCYPDSLDNISYEVINLKDIKKENHQLIFLINKQIRNQIKIFIDSFSIKKKREYYLDYYLYMNTQHNNDEVHIYAGLNNIYCMYYDQIGLKYLLTLDIEDNDIVNYKSKDRIINYYKNIVYKINYFLRVLYGYTISKVVFHPCCSIFTNDFSRYFHEVDHYQLEIVNEK